MTRNELIARVKELGIETERPAHQCKTEYLQSLIEVKQVEKAKSRGRKINPMSARQLRLATQIPGARGRRANPDSARQIKLALRAQRIANGEVIQRGRPKMVAID